MLNSHLFPTERRSSLEVELPLGKREVAGSIPASGSYPVVCRRSSGVERLTCNQQIGGSNPSGGSFTIEGGVLCMIEV